MPVKTAKNSNRLQKRRELLNAVAHFLEILSLAEYQDWCLKQGFSTNLNKTRADVISEFRRYKQREAFRAMRSISKQAELRLMVRKMYTNDIDYEELGSEQYKAIHYAFNDAEDKDLLRDVLLHVGERSRILESVKYIQSIENLITQASSWLRALKKWKPKSKNMDRQFQSLVRHLCAKYDVPVFMDTAWSDGEKKAIGWYMHIGAGKNIRTADGLPFKLTKKMAHYFLQAPEYYTPWTALRWAQVLSLGGQSRIADALLETRLCNFYHNNDFWITVIQFFVNNPLLHRMYYGPIIDFIFNRKYAEDVEVQDIYGVDTVGGGAPNFSMKGRTPESLLRQVNDWHRELGMVKKDGSLKWKGSNFAGLYFVEKNNKLTNKRIWTIRELLSSNELFQEGFVQNHCVATYDVYCNAGDSSIWTMETMEQDVKVKRLTIEVENNKNAITEVRGRNNRAPYPYEIDVLKIWAKKIKLTIEPYVLLND